MNLSINRLVLLFVFTLTMSGCAQSQPLAAADTESLNPYLPDEFLRISNETKRHFRYNDIEKFVWPPRQDMFGNIVGNCMTYSRAIQDELAKMGYSVRFKNVLAPTTPRAHVVAVATDAYGHDWVFDNRVKVPFPLELLNRYYERESIAQNSQVGAQRRKWTAVDRTLASH